MFPSHDRVVSVVKQLRGCEWSDTQAYELDSLMRWHYHTIMTCKKEPYFKKVQKKGWRINFKLIDSADHQKVIQYLQKVDQREIMLEALDWYSRAKKEYLFVEEEGAGSL